MCLLVDVMSTACKSLLTFLRLSEKQSCVFCKRQIAYVCTVSALCLSASQAMSKPKAPGSDRLANLPHHDSEVSGCPVLDSANATMDCTVVST